MSMQQRETRRSRRAFLRNSAVASGAAAMAAFAHGAIATTGAREAPARQEPPAQGYRETAHVRKYYEKARF